MVKFQFAYQIPEAKVSLRWGFHIHRCGSTPVLLCNSWSFRRLTDGVLSENHLGMVDVPADHV